MLLCIYTTGATSDIRNSESLGGISILMYADINTGGQTIVPALTKLFQLSLDSCTFPSSWKRANVTPLHKKK